MEAGTETGSESAVPPSAFPGKAIKSVGASVYGDSDGMSEQNTVCVSWKADVRFCLQTLKYVSMDLPETHS